jgi:uncharacterized protein YdeI (YjbR/CyaY-like superfamily)
MITSKLPAGTVHTKVPADLEKVLSTHPPALTAWNDITPLARNEWICLVEDAKQPATRARRIERARSQLTAGQRRPCCWQGCPHREKNGQ